MDKRSIILVVTLFVVVIAGMFTFAYLKRGEIVEAPVVVIEEKTEVPYSEIVRIDAKHFFIDDVHTFVGELNLPTPCDLLEVDSLVQETYPEKITLDFNVINNAEVCAQVITTQRFMTSVPASARATVSATFMGRVVDLNLIPAAMGETPDEFELYVKG